MLASSRLPENAARLPRLGERGEGWVVAQLALLVATFGAGLFDAGWPDAVDTAAVRVAGSLVALAGLALWLAGVRALGRALTPFPRPRPDAGLVRSGPYGRVRHPVYGGGIVFLLGYSLLTTSAAALASTAVVAVLLDAKARLEEAWLVDRHPGYGDYRRDVRRRLVPWVY